MNFFRRRPPKQENGPVTLKRQEKKVVEELYQLLCIHGEEIIRGKTTLSLTTPILISLNQLFKHVTDGANRSDFQVIKNNQALDEPITFIFDFVQKAVSLKIISGPISGDSPWLKIGHFKCLQVLEVRKVPIQFIKELTIFRRELRTLICCRSTNSIEQVVRQFGKESESLLSIPGLKTLNLSYNTIRQIDESVVYLPSLEILDLSFNCLVSAHSNHLPGLSNLNLGYNMIKEVPYFPQQLSKTLTCLILRNNNISSLEGIEMLSALEQLDMTSNCIMDVSILAPLAHLHHLYSIALLENPISYFPTYRLSVISKMSPVKRRQPVKLDGKKLDQHESYVSFYRCLILFP